VVPGSGRSTDQETADDERRPPGSFGVIDVAILIPQHDDEGRSATILPGVPLPEWALPSGPIAPEPDPAAAAADEAAAAAAAAAATAPPVPMAPPAPDAAPSGPPLEAPALVMSGAPTLDAPAPAEAAPVSPYAPPLPLGTNGPGPMRAGWDFPGSDFRELAHDEAVAHAAEAAEAAEVEAPVAAPAPALDPALALALTAPVPVLEPLAAPDAAAAPVAVATEEDLAAPADVPAGTDNATSADADEDDSDEDGAAASRRPLALLAIVGGVAVAGAVAAFVWPGFLVASEPAPVPVVPPVSAPAASAPVTLTTPASVGPYTQLTGAPAAALTRAVTASTLPGLSGPVSAVYGTGTTPAVTVIAWNAASPLGASAIPSAYAGFQGATSSVVTDITTTPVTAGGELQCGTTVVSGAPASLCFWADESTFGSVTVLEPSSPESAADTAVAVRAAVVGG
jgi:hypothetical protein